MKNFVLLHGFKGSADKNFFPWLKAELEKQRFSYYCPNLPDPGDPTEEEQVEFVMDNAKFDEETILFGHSLGTVVAMKVAEQVPHKIAGLVLAGAFLRPNFKDHGRPFEKTFSWKFDFAKIKQNTAQRKILAAINDYAVSLEQNQEVAKALDAEYIEVRAEDEHFCGKTELSILQALTN